MSIINNLKIQLDLIKSIPGVENVILTQRDGNPIISSGVWLSKEEIFHVSAATSAIYNVGLSLHGKWLKYLVIEGPKAKIMIVPISNKILSLEYFIALTSLSEINLGALFIKTKSALNEINYVLREKKELQLKPPLREFTLQQISDITQQFQAKKGSSSHIHITSSLFNLNSKMYQNCEQVLFQLKNSIPSLIYSSISLNGGFFITSIKSNMNFNLSKEVEMALSYSIFDTSNRYAWLLKKMEISSIFLDCGHYLQIIMSFEDGIFSSFIMKEIQRIGLIRLILPKYNSLIKEIFKKLPNYPNKGKIPNEMEVTALIR